MTTQLQTVLDALSDERYVTRYSQIEEAIAIVKEMMLAEPVGYFWRLVNPDWTCDHWEQSVPPYGTPLYTHPAPQAVPAGWIPVTEQQPEPEVTVLCYGPNRIDANLPWRIFTDWCGSKKDFGLGVTHWMPLPEAPAVEGGA